MKKYVLDLTVKSVERLHERYVLIKLTDEKPLPQMLPGQFVEVLVGGSPTTFLRRPISINFVDKEQNELWLLVATVGDGTRWMAQLRVGDWLNCMLPLGNGFTIDHSPLTIDRSPLTIDRSADAAGGSCDDANRVLLVGGGVGVAPLLYLGKCYQDKGIDVTFLLGARTRTDLLLLDEFRKYGRVLVTTEDGSDGEKGFVTNHSVLQQEHFGLIQCCGPTPMMKAVARYAREKGIACEVSLENLMACGLGACLCCVEKVKKECKDVDDSPVAEASATNVCVCKEGPVFNIERLLWQN